MTIVVRVPPGRLPERTYAAHVLLGEFLGLEWRLAPEERSDVALEVDGASSAVVYRDGLLGVPDDDWLQAASLPEPPPASSPYLWPDDPFGTAFFCLTRYEEHVVPARDAHDRFPATAAVEPRRPLVNEVVELLWRDLTSVAPRLRRREHAFAVVPTHDVDIPTCPGRAPRTLAIDVIRRRDPSLALRRISGADPCDTFDFLCGASERRGLRSAFYFIADDDAYPLASQAPLLARVAERGHEIGLHPSYDTYRDSERTGAELRRLREVAEVAGVELDRVGGRQHFLRWDAATTWRIWDELGLAYDSTLSWAEAAGFRAGVCYEYPVFDLGGRRMLSLRERPLVAMEATFLQYLALDRETALAAIADLKATCRRYGGQFVLLWHNNRLQGARDRALYEAVLDA